MTELKKQTFSAQFLRPNGIVGTLTILKSTFLLIRYLSLENSDLLF